MAEFIARRLMMMVPLIFGITVIIFLIVHMAPGDPAELQTELTQKASAKSRENLRRIYGLDKPLHVQYADWLRKLVTLDLGKSFTDGRTVTAKIAERLPITLTINVLSVAVIFAIAIPLGVYSAARQNSVFDRAATLAVFIGFSTPTFWFALLMMLLFGVQLGWLPISGISSSNAQFMTPMGRLADYAWHLILPVFVSAFGGVAMLSRFSRSGMLEVIRQDYIRTAYAKGLTERTVIMRHAMRNAMLPIVTIVGLMVPTLIGGSVIFETIFAIPGMGKMFYESVMSRDYPVILGVLFIMAVLTMLGNLLADIAYGLIDPRIRVSGR